MKKVLGLDLGVSSVGWALVNQAENSEEKSSIIKAGVRIVPLGPNEADNFEKGKPCETNVARRMSRSMRRNLQRYKLRKSNLKQILKEAGWITDSTILTEHSNKSTFETYMLRSKAVSEEVSLEQFARILLMINKKRGYKSNRKASGADGQAFDGIEVAKELVRTGQTPGQYGFAILKTGKKYVPPFYRSDLQSELNRIWEAQKQYHPEILTDEFKEMIAGKGRNDVSKLFLGRFKIYTADNKGKLRKYQSYEWRDKALSVPLSQDVLAYVISDLSGAINSASDYLAKISDHSKELIIKNITVGQFLYENIQANPHFSTKNLVFYRNDYIDEFNKLWDNQSKYHKELTPELKDKIKDEIIFYQRRLKSQKHLISICELERTKVHVFVDGKEKDVLRGPKVAPKSSFIFQEFKMWQILNNLVLTDKDTGEQRFLELSEMKKLATELKTRDKISSAEALKILFKSNKGKDLNYKSLEGNATYSAIVGKFTEIANSIAGTEYDVKKQSADDSIDAVRRVFESERFNSSVLEMDTSLSKEKYEQQPLFKLWHLLYSYEGDDSRTGNESLVCKIEDICCMPREFAQMVAAITFPEDYGSLSHKAMRRILPFLKQGHVYSEACELAGYKHSVRSLTKEEIESKDLVERLDVLPKNSLHNPVVEKILNQMINVVNSLADEYGKPDEVHIEFARELKKNQQQRQTMTADIAARERENARIEEILHGDPFNIQYVRKSDILRYRLYEELKANGYKTLYSNQYVPQELLFSNSIDIEHIIPQSVLFDDSYSNKTIEFKDVNIEKGNKTAWDYVASKTDAAGLEQYKARVESLFYAGAIKSAKCRNLLKKSSDLPQDFLNRDLTNSQYIAREAREILESFVRVVMPTTGSITAKLREDWQLVDVMKELNMQKYSEAGLTHMEQHGDHRAVEKIDDWTKRQDHRHHAMDALTIAFTKPSHIQYLSYSGEKDDPASPVFGIRQKETVKVKDGKRIFMPPMPLDELRAAFKKELESTLVSIKAKNKVVTRNVNRTKKKNGYNTQVTWTPRGQLHKETIYGARQVYEIFHVPVGAKLSADVIESVASQKERNALRNRLAAFGGDPKKAFTGANAISKNPIWLDPAHSEQLGEKVKCVHFKRVYSVRKNVDATLSVDKVMDENVKRILKARLEEYGGNAAKAFSNLDENPIWLNKDKGIAIKKVTIAENFDLDAIREKRDNKGQLLRDKDGNSIASEYVNLRNNHHVAVFRDTDGKCQEHIVSFFEALERVNNGFSAVDKSYKKEDGWEFLFSMKRNEMFVFPNPKTGFDPHAIDLMDSANYRAISPNLFRVQKISRGDYWFRHHIDTGLDDIKQLRDIHWKRITAINDLAHAVKVRVNNIGQIVAVGEYD